MMRAPVWALALLLSGCAADRALPVQYDFDGTFDPVQTQRLFDATIAIPPITAPPWLRTTALVYRLGYEPPATLRSYTLSQWVAPPAELLTLRLRQSVEARNRGITLGHIPLASSGYSLEASLDTFTQVFSSSDQSLCEVVLRVTLVTHGNEVIAQKTFSAEQPAPTPDAAGGVQGLVAAADVDVRNIIMWLQETLKASSTAASIKPGDTPH
jgi:cholesterol transport system auxiliary component